jgi:hypothetical protein
MDRVLPSDYDKLVVARQHELAYIAETLKKCRKVSISDVRDELNDLEQWLNSRRTCYAVAGATPQ